LGLPQGIGLSPAFPRVAAVVGLEHPGAEGTSVNGLRSRRVDCQRSDREIRQTVVDPRPGKSVVSGLANAAANGADKNGSTAFRVAREPRNTGRGGADAGPNAAILLGEQQERRKNRINSQRQNGREERDVMRVNIALSAGTLENRSRESRGSSPALLLRYLTIAKLSPTDALITAPGSSPLSR
jgi:hypothetical protein